MSDNLIWTLESIAALRETDELEVKLAAGRDGRGELPKDFWPTYSSFANGAGGFIALGVREKSGAFSIDAGIMLPDKVRGQIFDQVCNPQKVSVNLLAATDVEVIDVRGKHIIVVRVPAASRQHKPVYIDGNPLTGTYRRLHDGDRLCDADTVKRMLAEQTEDSRDNRILKGYSLEDINVESIEVYRRLLRDARPQHPFLELPTFDFLKSIRAWRRDRETELEGLTVAGLLMFGTSEAIRDEFPNYTVDYQERDEPKAARWIDRLTNDGTWSGNLFDFYRAVWRKIVTGLKMPFQLVGAQRQDETSAHIALREALVNCIVHADFSGRASVLIVRRPDMFGFRNPGGMRIPLELAIRGGESDGRNRTLQQMFLLIGAGERAGSGVPKIHKGWREQHWRPPSLYEIQQPSDQTLLELHMEDLLPPEVVDSLHRRFGEGFDHLQPDERVVLATAQLETTVSHARAMTLCEMHPVDMTRLLQSLVQNGFLEKVGQGRGTRYHLPGAQLADPDQAFLGASLMLPGIEEGEATELEVQPSEFVGEPSDLSSGGSKVDSEVGRGRTVSGLDMLLIDDVSELDPGLREELNAVAGAARMGRVPKTDMEDVILELCNGRYLTLRVLAALLGRSEDYLRPAFLNPLARGGRIKLAFPQKPNDPRQAYSAAVEATLD